MSFLNSVLSSIGSDNPQASVTAPPRFERSILQPHPSNPSPSDNKNAAQSDVANNKRRAEDALSEPQKKVVKTPSLANVANGGTRKPESSAVRNMSGGGLAPVSPSGQPLSYRASKMPNTSAAPQGSSQSSKKEVEGPKKEPKKGSFAEIMARAQSNSSKPQAIGTISHKPKDKMAMSYKKEIKLSKQAGKQNKKDIAQKGSLPSSAGSTGTNSPRSSKLGQELARPGAPPAKAKPQPIYKGTMHARSPATVATSKEKSRQHKRRQNEYAGTDEELDEEDDYDENEENDDGSEGGYGSESSDDMEAGFYEVEREETTAAKQARLEDEKEAQLEAKLKREKEEKKRKLEALVKKAKPPRY